MIKKACRPFYCFQRRHEVPTKYFFTRQDVFSTLNAQGTDLKSFVNSKYMFQLILVKKLLKTSE